MSRLLLRCAGSAVAAGLTTALLLAAAPAQAADTHAFATSLGTLGANRAAAAVTYAAPALSATTTATTATATVTLTASTTVLASEAGVCAQDSAGVYRDFPRATGVTLSPAGWTTTLTRAYAPGTYSYWGCAKINGGWYNIGARKTFTVGAAPATTTPTTAPATTTAAPTTPVTTAPTTPVTTTAASSTPVTTAPVTSTPTSTPSSPTTYGAADLTATVTGQSVTATTRLTATRPVTASDAGICVKDADGVNRNFPLESNVPLTPTGFAETATKSFDPGTYSYWGCVKVGGGWYDVGARKTFTVAIPDGPIIPIFFTTYSATNLTATVSGAQVTATASISATRLATASQVGICVTDAQGVSQDFPKQTDVLLSPTPHAMTSTRVFVPGTYTYRGCALIGTGWYRFGTPQTFTVTAAGNGEATASGEAMPKGNLPGFTQIFSDDFATAQAEGQFPGVYGTKWKSYDGFPDTSQRGDYDQDIISVHDGVLDMHLRTGADGRPKSAAPIPLLTSGGTVTGQVYGRYSVRFKADSLAGYGMAGLLWPSSGIWADGEIDYPEGSLDSTMWAYTHCVGNPTRNCSYLDTQVSFTGWHTATIEWLPGKINYVLDGRVLQTVTNSVPTKAMQWVLQTGTTGDCPAAATQGHVLIDWVSVWKYTG